MAQVEEKAGEKEMEKVDQGAFNRETPAISCIDLCKSFAGYDALRHVNLDVREGEIFGLLGPNGAGKTTTMRIISCLVKPSSGIVCIDGMNVCEASNTVSIRRRIGLLTENPNLYERLTAEQNLRFFAKAYDIKESNVEERVAEILRSFDLFQRKRDKVGTFSKGMKQKLAIGRALLHKPSILLLDEPTSALDAESAKSIRELIRGTAENGDHTIMLSTHNLDDASRLCTRLAILSRGEILARGTESELARETRKQGSLKEIGLRVRIELIETGAFSIQKLLATFQKGVESARAYRNGMREGIEFYLEPSLTDFEVDLLTSKIVSFMVGLGAEVALVEPVKVSLEEIYTKTVAVSRRSRGGSAI